MRAIISVNVKFQSVPSSLLSCFTLPVLNVDVLVKHQQKKPLWVFLNGQINEDRLHERSLFGSGFSGKFAFGTFHSSQAFFDLYATAEKFLLRVFLIKRIGLKARRKCSKAPAYTSTASFIQTLPLFIVIPRETFPGWQHKNKSKMKNPFELTQFNSFFFSFLHGRGIYIYEIFMSFAVFKMENMIKRYTLTIVLQSFYRLRSRSHNVLCFHFKIACICFSVAPTSSFPIPAPSTDLSHKRKSIKTRIEGCL